jgi:very-short-patch-repair endonuclease
MNVKCEICGGKYKRITNYHLRKHSIDMVEYKKMYPDAIIITEESRMKYAESTRKHHASLSKEEKDKIYSNRVYSEEQKKRHLEILEAGRKSINYKDSIRNEKISKSRKKYWGEKSIEERSLFIKNKVIPKYKSNMGGEEEYNKMMRKKGHNGNLKLIELGKKKTMNNFEKEMYDILMGKGYECIWQYEINGWYYDVYIKNKNIIVELDGDYWHPIDINEESTDREKRQYRIDRLKEKIAGKLGYQLIRIRQSEKHLIQDI